MIRVPRLAGAGLLALALLSHAGCIVVALHPFYGDAALVVDDRLLGAWQNADDNVTVTVERGEWRSYRVQYSYPTEQRVLTGYLFKAGEGLYLDLSPLRGEDPGAFLLPAHALVRLVIGDGEIRAAGLNYDWFVKAIADKSLAAELMAAHAERGQIVLSADRPVIERWLRSLPASDAMWSESAVFKRPK